MALSQTLIIISSLSIKPEKLHSLKFSESALTRRFVELDLAVSFSDWKMTVGLENCRCLAVYIWLTSLLVINFTLFMTTQYYNCSVSLATGTDAARSKWLLAEHIVTINLLIFAYFGFIAKGLLFWTIFDIELLNLIIVTSVSWSTILGTLCAQSLVVKGRFNLIGATFLFTLTPKLSDLVIYYLLWRIVTIISCIVLSLAIYLLLFFNVNNEVCILLHSISWVVSDFQRIQPKQFAVCLSRIVCGPVLFEIGRRGTLLAHDGHSILLVDKKCRLLLRNVAGSIKLIVVIWGMTAIFVDLIASMRHRAICNRDIWATILVHGDLKTLGRVVPLLLLHKQLLLAIQYMLLNLLNVLTLRKLRPYLQLPPDSLHLLYLLLSQIVYRLAWLLVCIGALIIALFRDDSLGAAA